MLNDKPTKLEQFTLYWEEIPLFSDNPNKNVRLWRKKDGL